MRVSAKGRKEIIAHEGKRLQAYLDGGGVWTIGVGHTAFRGPPKPVKGMVITDQECDDILANDLVHFENKVNEIVKVDLNQNQFDALVSLCFNIGEGAFAKSTLVRKLNAGDYAGAADQFMVWNKDNGKTVQGLTNRRAKEKALFLTPVAKQEAPTKAPEAPPAVVVAPPATEVATERPSLLGTLLIVLWQKLTGKTR
jgi:lysozyme